MLNLSPSLWVSLLIGAVVALSFAVDSQPSAVHHEHSAEHHGHAAAHHGHAAAHHGHAAAHAHDGHDHGPHVFGAHSHEGLECASHGHHGHDFTAASAPVEELHGHHHSAFGHHHHDGRSLYNHTHEEDHERRGPPSPIGAGRRVAVQAIAPSLAPLMLAAATEHSVLPNRIARAALPVESSPPVARFCVRDARIRI